MNVGEGKGAGRNLWRVYGVTVYALCSPMGGNMVIIDG